jgi:hypothetical protein
MNINIDTGSLLYTSAAQPVIIKNNGNPFDVTVTFQKPHDGITKIALKNAQIPIGFYNIRSPYNTITFGSTTYTLTPGNYSATTFLSALNSATSAIGSWSYVSATNLMQFTSTSGTVTLVIPTGLTYPTLASLLGFVSTQTLTGTNLVSRNSYIINFDTYINIYFDNIGRPSIEPSKSTFKIPVEVPSGSILYWSKNKQDEQCVQVRDQKSVDKLIVAVYDRFGNIIDNNGLDWSFTLEMKSDN